MTIAMTLLGLSNLILLVIALSLHWKRAADEVEQLIEVESLQHKLVGEEKLVANLRQLVGQLLGLNQDMQDKLIKQDAEELRNGTSDL